MGGAHSGQDAFEALPVASLGDARGGAPGEQAFGPSKALGGDDVIAVVVPRSRVPEYLHEVDVLAAKHDVRVGRVGHVGDGNDHLSVVKKDLPARKAFMHDLFAASTAMGGVVSAEHGIGTEKVAACLEVEYPRKAELMKSIKRGFDPQGLLNPGVLFG